MSDLDTHPLASWNGEPAALLEFDDDLCDDGALCEITFLSKREAYLQGRIIGKLLAEQTPYDQHGGD